MHYLPGNLSAALLRFRSFSQILDFLHTMHVNNIADVTTSRQIHHLKALSLRQKGVVPLKFHTNLLWLLASSLI